MTATSRRRFVLRIAAAGAAGCATLAIRTVGAQDWRLLRTREIREQMVAQGFDVIAQGPEALAREVDNGTPKWARLVREAGARLE